MNKIAVIDYGMGNLHSVAKALEYVGRELDEQVEVVVTDMLQCLRNRMQITHAVINYCDLIHLKTSQG